MTKEQFELCIKDIAQEVSIDFYEGTVAGMNKVGKPITGKVYSKQNVLARIYTKDGIELPIIFRWSVEKENDAESIKKAYECLYISIIQTFVEYGLTHLKTLPI